MDPKEVTSEVQTALILDVREQFEWDAGHIDGALHIPMNEIPGRLDEIPKEHKVIVVCHLGQRSAHVAQFLGQQGYKVENLDGGLEAWSAAGLPLTD